MGNKGHLIQTVKDFFMPQMSQDDFNALKNFNTAMENGASPIRAYTDNMKNAGTEAQKLAKSGVVAAKGITDTSEAAMVAKVNLDTLTTSSKATEIGLKALRIAGNMLLALAISEAISLVIKGVDYLIHRNEKLIESANEVTNTYREQSKTLNDNVSSLQKQKDEFNRLSQGVDDYGNNISLTSDEYDRYKSIVSEILGYTPGLIAGYDEEGNAIAKKNGLIEQSIELMKEEQRQKLKEMTSDKNTETVLKGVKAEHNNKIGIYNNAVSNSNEIPKAVFNSANGKILPNITGGKLYASGDAAMNDELLQTFLLKYKDAIRSNIGNIYNELVNSGHTTDEAKKYIDWLKDVLNKAEDIDKQAHGMDDQFSLYAQKSDYYEKLSDAQKNFVTEYIKATGSIIDAEGNFLSNDKIQQMANGYTKFVDELVTNDKFEEARDKMNDLFSLDKSKLSASDYEQQVDAILDYLVQEIDGFEQDNANKIKISLGFEFLSDGNTQVSELIEQVKGKLQDAYDGIVDKMTLKDLILAVKIDATDLTEGEFREEMAKLKAEMASAFSLDSFNKEVDGIQSAYDTLAKARDEYNKNGKYSLDTVQTLLALEPEYLAMLVDENGQLAINEQSMADMMRVKIENAKADIYSASIKKLNALIEAAQTKNTNDNKDALDKETESFEANTKAAYDNILAKAYGNNNIDHSDIDAVRDWTQDAIDMLTDVENNLSLDFNGVVGGFSDTSDKIQDTQEKLEDLAKSEALTQLKYKFDQIEQSITKVDNALSLLNNTLDLTSENDYTTKLEITSRMLGLAQQNSALLRNEFAQLSAQEYSSADSANEIATRMKSVADSIAENNKNIIEYSKNITEYYTSALTSVSLLSKTTIDEATDLLDRNIKSLSEGGLTGLQFNLSPTIPKSALDKQKEQNYSMEAEMQSYYDTIAQMQKVALDLEYQEQMQSYAEQRVELDNTLSSSKAKIQQSAEETQEIQKNTNTATSEEQKRDNEAKVAETQNFADSEKNVINDLNDWMKQNPITSPELDKTAWEGLVADAENYATKIKDIISDTKFNVGNGNSNGIVATAKQYLGTPYIWGGTSEKGWDCSGYVQNIMSKNGISVGRTTDDQWFGSQGQTIKDISMLQPGDALYFSKDGGKSTYHTAIYIGNGKMVHAKGAFSGTIEDDFDGIYKKRFIGAKRFYAKGTQDFGIAGENYKKEWAINKKTGEWSKIDSPTLFNKNEYEIVSEKVSEKIDKPIQAYATGTPISDPKILQMVKMASEQTGVPTNVLLSVIDQESGNQWIGKKWDGTGYSYGYMQLHDGDGELTDMINQGGAQSELARKAMVDPYTNILVGAQTYKKLYDKYGNWADAASAYNMGEGGFAKSGRNSYGNQVLERANSDLFIKAAKQLGSMSTDLSSIASGTSSIKVDVGTRIKALIEGRTSTTATNGNIEDGLISFVEENLVKTEGINERLIDAFSAMATVDDEYKGKIGSLIQSLKDNAETANYANVRTEMSNVAKDYADAITGEQVKYEAIAIKEQFDIAKQAQELALQYFNQKKAEGATADELAVISEGYAEITNTMQEYSDKYVSIMSSYTDYLVSGADREMRAFDDRISWIDDANNDLQDVADNTSSVAEKTAAWGKMIDNCNDKQALLADKMDKAHQEAENIRHSAEFAPIMEAFDTYAWFDADGNATAQFEADQMALSEVNPELVPLLNRAFELLQKYTQEWRSANDESKDNSKLIKDIQLEQANDKIELQAKVYDQINKRLDLRLNKERAITNALQEHNSFLQSLRDSALEYESELIAIKHLESYLDPQAKELLFNDNDYSNIINEMDSIQAEATKAYKKYQAEISKLGDEDYFKEQKLTEAYNQQVEKLKERLEVSKKELEVTKKQLEYNNTLKERDTRVILGGRPINIADPDKLYNAELAKAKAEKERDNILQDNIENQQVRNMEMDSATTQELISANNKYVETLQALDDDEKIRHAEQMASTEELTASLHALSTDYIPWLNEYNYEFRDQMAGFDETEWGRGYDYNYDHAEGFEKFWEKFYDAGIISKEYEGIMQMRTENQRNYKVKSDPDSIQYAPQTTKYGGTLKPDMYGKNDDAILAEYVTDKMSPQEILDTMIEKRNSHGGYLSEGDYAIAANAETVLNRQRFKNGQFDQQTSQWNGLLFDLDNADFTQSNQALMDFCTENGGVTAQEAEYFNTYKEYQDKYNSYAELLLSVGVDVSEQLSRLNENIRESFKEALSVRTISPTNLDHFASGTKSAKGGLAITDEDGYEAKLREIQAGRYTLLKEDDMIFSKADTNKLWELVKNPSTFLSDQMKNITTPTLPQVNNVQNNNDNSMAVHNHFNGDIVMTESISNGSEFITDLGIQLNSRFDVTKNMKR